MSRTTGIILACAGLAALIGLSASAIWYVRSQSAISSAQSQSIYVRDGPPQTMPSDPDDGKPRIRCAVIGGMTFTGFWCALAQRYRAQTGVHLDVMATGPKMDITRVFKAGDVDLITMHASDAIVNLVADGYALDPQPWMRNDLIIVGPPSDPAGIRGMTDAAEALKKIAAAKSPFVVHSSLGAQEVLVNILEWNNIQLDPATITVLFDDQQRSVLKVAGDKKAYTLVGRIPFRIGRLPNNGLELMVQGDPRLRRPYLVAVSNPARMPGVRYEQARRFAEFLRTPATQRWIAQYGRGVIDDQPLFFPVDLSGLAGVAARQSNPGQSNP